jgi:hypothetical protein
VADDVQDKLSPAIKEVVPGRRVGVDVGCCEYKVAIDLSTPPRSNVELSTSEAIPAIKKEVKCKILASLVTLCLLSPLIGRRPEEFSARGTIPTLDLQSYYFPAWPPPRGLQQPSYSIANNCRLRLSLTLSQSLHEH